MEASRLGLAALSPAVSILPVSPISSQDWVPIVSFFKENGKMKDITGPGGFCWADPGGGGKDEGVGGGEVCWKKLDSLEDSAY